MLPVTEVNKLATRIHENQRQEAMIANRRIVPVKSRVP